jgi:tetratricopeptide (TPR) repeat protein
VSDIQAPREPGAVFALADAIVGARRAMEAADPLAAELHADQALALANAIGAVARLVRATALSRSGGGDDDLAAAVEAVTALDPSLLQPDEVVDLADGWVALHDDQAAANALAALEHLDASETVAVDLRLAELRERTGEAAAAADLLAAAAAGLIALDRGFGAVAVLRRAVALAPDEAHLHAALARQLVRANDFAGAVEAAEAGLASHPDDVDLLRQHAEALRLLERYPEAQAVLDRLAAVDPAPAWGTATRGQVLFAMGQVEDARTALDAAVAEDGSVAWIHASRSSVLAALGLIDDAIEAVEAAFDAGSGPGALIQRGEYELRAERFEDVLVTAERVAAQLPDDDHALMQLRIRALVELDRLREANAVVDRAIATPNAPADVLLDRAFSLARLGRLDELRDTSHLIRDSFPGPAAMLEGFALLQQGDPSAARDVLRSATEADLPPYGLLILGQARLGLREYAEALAVLDAAAARDQTLAGLQTYRAYALAGLERMDEAAVAFDADDVPDAGGDIWLLTARADVARALLRWERVVSIVEEARRRYGPGIPAMLDRYLGEALFRLGQYERARTELEAVIEKHPDQRIEALELLVYVRYSLDDYDGALDAIADVLVDQPDNALFYGLRAEVLAARNDLPGALEAYETALDKDGQWLPAHQGKAVVLRQLDRLPESLAAADAGLALFPGHEALLQERAEVLRLEGQLTEARAVVDRLIASRSDNSWALGTRGQILRALADQRSEATSADSGADPEAMALLEQAVHDLEDAAALQPDTVWIQYERSVVLERTGRSIGALAVLDTLLTLQPNDVQTHLRRAALLQQLGRLDEALLAVRRADELTGPDGDREMVDSSAIEIAYALANADQSELALDALSSGGWVPTLDLASRALRADLLRAVGRVNEALAGAEQILTEDPDYVYSLGTKAMALLDQGQRDEALAVARRALELDSSYVYARKVEAIALAGLNNYTASLAIMNEYVLPDAPQDEWSRRMVAALLSGLGRFPDAERVLSELIDENAGNYAAHALRADIWIRYPRRLRDGIDAFEEATTSSNATEAWWFPELGDAYADRDSELSDDARTAFGKAVAELVAETRKATGGTPTGPIEDAMTPANRSDYAWGRFRLGEVDEALRIYDSGRHDEAVVTPDSGDALASLVAGRVDEAKERFARFETSLSALEDQKRAAQLRRDTARTIRILRRDGTLAKADVAALADFELRTGEENP